MIDCNRRDYSTIDRDHDRDRAQPYSHATEIHTDSIRAMQWLTATIGLFHSCATVRATTATDIRGAAMPGPTTHHELIAQITTNSEWSK